MNKGRCPRVERLWAGLAKRRKSKQGGTADGGVARGGEALPHKGLMVRPPTGASEKRQSGWRPKVEVKMQAE